MSFKDTLCRWCRTNCRFHSAGVIGLDVAYLLSERGYASQITVIAEHLPGDTSINYTSPWYVVSKLTAKDCMMIDFHTGLGQIFLPSPAVTPMHSDGTGLGTAI
jgi:hypothetical protein